MSDENRPLREWTTSHLLGALGLLAATAASWVTLNERIARVESDRDIAREYRIETRQKLTDIERNQTRLMMALGVKPEN